jgi:hypothetical protein
VSERTIRAVAPLRALALLVVLLLVPGERAAAHELSLARFHLARGAGTDSYELVVTLTGSAALAEPRPLRWPERCRESATTKEASREQTVFRIRFECPGGLQPTDVVGTSWGSDGGIFTSELAESSFSVLLAGDGGGVAVPIGRAESRARGAGDVAVEYGGLGMSHILEGWDHLAFVLCLCLLVTGTALLWLVSAFTIGHSISLALAYLGYVSVPMMPVEAIIALSVAFMAREALFARRASGTDRARAPALSARYLAVVTGFGLLHGLGFASQLDDLGVSARERVVGLLSFNVGVELGQLLFVALALTALVLTRVAGVERHARLAALYGAGALGMFWFLDRVVLFVRMG